MGHASGRTSIGVTHAGTATAYSLLKMKTGGSFAIDPAEEVYAGMCIGIHNKDIDIERSSGERIALPAACA